MEDWKDLVAITGGQYPTSPRRYVIIANEDLPKFAPVTFKVGCSFSPNVVSASISKEGESIDGYSMQDCHKDEVGAVLTRENFDTFLDYWHDKFGKPW